MNHSANLFRGWLFAALAVAALGNYGVGQAADVVPNVIYGTDNRQEVRGLTGFDARNAASTVALVDASAVRSNGDGTSRLAAPTLAAAYGVCPSERFRNQPIAAFCSGFLVKNNIVVTAGHCINNYPYTLANTRFVFGYRLLASGQVQNRIPNSAIYRGVQVLADREAAADFAVVRLDRNVSPQVPLPIQRSGAVAVNTPLYVIGYPSGLPAKVATGAHVIASNADFFRANLDTYGGNSGSPVFNATNDKVVGVLVRGAADYVQRGSCYVSSILPNSTGQEESTRTTRIAPFVPAGG